MKARPRPVIPVIADPNHPSGPRVAYVGDVSRELIDRVVETACPGYEVGWELAEVNLTNGYKERPLRRRPGRPSRDGFASGRLTIRVSAPEREAWKRAAGDRSLTEWIREQCNAAVPQRGTR